MSIRLQKELILLKERISTLGTMVEAQLSLAIESLLSRDSVKAHRVVVGDDAIDEFEVELEEECLKVLALHQPVAVDMRFIIAVLKINNNLEQIGDLAVSIAERAQRLSVLPSDELEFAPIRTMSVKVRAMLREGLFALVEFDKDSAANVFAMEDEVDQLNRDLFHRSLEALEGSPKVSKSLLHALSVSKSLERVGDLAANIAEDVLYMMEGEIIRHRIFTKIKNQ